MIARRIPWTLIVFLIAAAVPWLGSRYDTFLAAQIAIDAAEKGDASLVVGLLDLLRHP